MSEKKFVEGEVFINGYKTSAKLSPYICESGFWLWNRAGGFAGPHTDICLSPQDFAAHLSSDVGGEVKVALDGVRLGKIDECSGYAAADVGPHSRRIQECIFSVSRSSRCTRFEFEGQTGYLVPESVSAGGQRFLEQSEKYKFKIWFLIPDQETQFFFKDECALQAINAYVSRHASG